MSGFKKFFLFALLPAIIVGLFSLAPKIYDELFRPKPILTYDLSTGPAIQVGSSYQRIYSVKISNVGKKVLNKVTGTFQIIGTVKKAVVE